MSTQLGNHTFCAIPQLMLGSSLGLEWLVGDFCRGPMMMRHGGHFCVAPSLEPKWYRCQFVQSQNAQQFFFGNFFFTPMRNLGGLVRLAYTGSARLNAESIIYMVGFSWLSRIFCCGSLSITAVG